MYTSGTTGEPKGVILTNGAIMAQVLAIDHILLLTDKVVYNQSTHYVFLRLNDSVPFLFSIFLWLSNLLHVKSYRKYIMPINTFCDSNLVIFFCVNNHHQILVSIRLGLIQKAWSIDVNLWFEHNCPWWFSLQKRIKLNSTHISM